MTQLQELKDKRDFYYRELEDLHIYEPSEEWYKVRRYEIESQICFIEDAIDQLETRQKANAKVFKYLMIALGLTLLIGLIALI
jgi:hypothetical protein